MAGDAEGSVRSMIWIWRAFAVLGFSLATWARWCLPPWLNVNWPTPVQPRHVTRGGPYGRWHHPGYIGTLLMITGFAGMAAGFWNALAVGSITELVLREWAHRETGHPTEHIFRRQ
jgi:protein-S-isoprenylcysteine O-methyltransferase Ste14